MEAEPVPSVLGSELTRENLLELAAATAPPRKPPLKKRRGWKKRKRGKQLPGTDQAGRLSSLASPAGSWSGRTPARGQAPGLPGMRTSLGPKAPWTTPHTAPPAPLNTTEDAITRQEASKEDGEAQTGSAINFFGSNADSTRHFAEEDLSSEDEGTGTEPGELEEQAARIASLEQDKALLAAENEKLHAEVESLRRQLSAARQEQLGEQLGQPQLHTPSGLQPVPA